jgi:hypothetical protein
MEIQTKDGITLRGIPDGTPDDVIKARIEKIRAESATVEPAAPQSSKALGIFETDWSPQKALQNAGDMGAGALRGAASIGSTIVAPFKAAFAGTGQTGAQEQRKQILSDVEQGLTAAGADTNSPNYAVGKFGAELAGTAGIGGGMAKAAQAGGAAPSVIRALETYGLQTGLVPKGVAQILANTALKAGAGAVTGGATAGIIDPESAGTGATIGAVAGPALSSASSLVRMAKDAAMPSAGVFARKAAGDRADDVIAAMRQTQSRVPGVSLTAGQAAVPANSAEFSALQKAAAMEDASKFVGPAGVKGQQESARQAAVQSFGKTPADLEAAVNARSAASAQNYANAFQQQINGDPALVQIFKNPYIEDVLPEALKLAKAKGITPKADLTEFLDSVKKGLDAKLEGANNPALPAISSEVKKEILNAKKSLVGWLDNKNPAYKAARQTHLADSIPINQMQAGQVLEQALVAPATNAERASVFANKVRQMENTISKKSGAPAIDALTPAQRDVVQAIEEDFKRNQAFKELATAGRQGMEERIGAPILPASGVFMPVVNAARSWANKALGTGHSEALKRVAGVMHDPVKMAKLMEAASPAQRKILETLLQQRAIQAGVVASAED